MRWSWWSNRSKHQIKKEKIKGMANAIPFYIVGEGLLYISLNCITDPYILRLMLHTYPEQTGGGGTPPLQCRINLHTRINYTCRERPILSKNIRFVFHTGTAVPQSHLKMCRRHIFYGATLQCEFNLQCQPVCICRDRPPGRSANDVIKQMLCCKYYTTMNIYFPI